MTDTVAERLRRGPGDWQNPEQALLNEAADAIERLEAERDAAVAKVDVAEAGYRAAVSKAQWQASTNAELNRHLATVERYRAALEELVEARWKGSGGNMKAKEEARLRKIAHAAWHLIDDNSDGDDGIEAVPKSDIWLAQLSLLLEFHPESPASSCAPVSAPTVSASQASPPPPSADDPTREDGELPPDATPAELWAEIYRLRADAKGPDGYATWKEAAIAERLRAGAASRKGDAIERLTAESERYRAALAELVEARWKGRGGNMKAKVERWEAAWDAASAALKGEG